MTATNSKLEKLSFSGKDEDFAAFSEQFEARMHMLNLGKCLEDKLTVPAYKEDETRGEETARVKAERTRGRSSDSWSGANLFSARTRLQSTSSAFTSLESHCGEASQHREASHSDVAHSAGWIEDGTRGESDRLPHHG